MIAYPTTAGIIQGTAFVPITDFGLPLFWGHFGVALFFLISGFVIPFSMAPLSRAGFVTARVFRIWPTYLVGLSIAVTCIAINSMLSKIAFPFSAAEILKNALIFPRWPTLTRSIDGINWTLEIELFFYAVCAAMMNVIRHFDRRIFFCPALVMPLSYILASQADNLIAKSTGWYALAHWASNVPGYVCFMLCGTAFYYHFRGRTSPVELLTAQAFSFLGFGFVIGDWSAITCYLIAYAMFALGYFARDRVVLLPDLARQTLRRLADISYPLYAVHGVLGYTLLVHMVEAGVPAWVAVITAFAMVLGVAASVHRMIELPSQLYGKTLAVKMDGL